MAGGIRGGRGAREIIGLRESGLEARPRAGMSSLPGGLGAERRLPELAAAADAKRRFDERHREAVEYEFDRAFHVFHEREGPGLFSGKKGFLFFPGFREVSPADFANAKPKEKAEWTLESLWSAVQRPETMILFVPWVISLQQMYTGGGHSGQFWFSSLRRALDLGLSPSSILDWLGFSNPDSGIRIKTSQSPHASDIYRNGTSRYLSREAFAPKDVRGVAPEKPSAGPDSKPPASRRTDIIDFARHMDSVQIQRNRMDELALHGFSVGEQLEFLKKLDKAPTAQTGSELAAAPFFERKRKLSPPSLPIEELGIPLSPYNAEILWDGNSNSWTFRPLPKANWTVWRGGELRDARHPEMPIFDNDSLRTKMEVDFLPEVLVFVDISLQVNAEGRRELVVTEGFHKVDPKLRGSLPIWGRSAIP